MEGFIEVKNLSKSFPGKDGQIDALQDINLSINQGEIYGIIGMSGAGKSTLVRCFNFLERPTKGTVIIDGKDLSEMNGKALRLQRRDIAMIFQHFNLLMQKNVIQNICFPLRIIMSKQAAKKRAEELLEIVGISEKAKAYPSQLSGGQKQRVAIARALAANPKILICDEATSALDPQITQSILDLLKSINEKFGITIVIITHEMDVVQQICSKVAIVEKGRIVEEGTVTDVFTHPKTAEAQKLIYGNATGIQSDRKTVSQMQDKRKVRIVFQENSAFEPVIANMVLETGEPVNILYANTQNIGGIAKGEMILALPEDDVIAHQMMMYLKQHGLAVEEVETHVDE